MSHQHKIYDTDTHFSINPITRAIKNESSTKTMLIQGDHNSERFTFEIPRYIEGHDMSLSNKVEIHYTNIASNKTDKSADVYIADDVQLSPDSEDVVIFSWLISCNATKYAGILSFLIRFTCLTGETIDYAFNTAVFSNISIGTGMNNSEQVLEANTDNLEEWFNKRYDDTLGDVDAILQAINEGGIT